MTPRATRPAGAVAALVLALVVTGFVSRAAPLLDPGGRLLRQFPTEDGYLMLTIARNLALGRGMSIAGGSIPTNGTQPLATFAWAAAFASVGGERVAGVAVVQLIELAIACGAGLLLWRLGRRVLAPGPAALGAATWFASPVVVAHSMNALESGLYVACLLLVLLAVVPAGAGGVSGLGRWAGVGLVLGLAFLARNDAVLLCGAVGAAHLFGALGGPERAPLSRRVAELACAAGAAFAVALPWLVYNVARFGHLVPISGQAESLDVSFAENLALVPAALFEYLTLLLPIPAPLEAHPAVVAACSALVAAAAIALCALARRWPHERRALFAIGAIHALALCAFYGLLFGAGHFLSRYLLPLSLYLALVWGGSALAVLPRLRAASAAPLPALAGVTLLLLAVGLNLRLYLRGDGHSHFGSVEWVQQNVPADTWVAAIQTGTLGFFHERTINLDGKVNPEALEARRHGRIPEYVADGEIQYLVDWVGIAGWMELPAIAAHFELLFADAERNLAVLRRREDAG